MLNLGYYVFSLYGLQIMWFFFKYFIENPIFLTKVFNKTAFLIMSSLYVKPCLFMILIMNLLVNAVLLIFCVFLTGRWGW